MMSKKSSLLLLVILGASCKTTNISQSRTKFSSQQAVKSLTIEGPFKDLIYNRREEEFDPETLVWKDSYQKVKVTYDSKTFEGSVRQRGGISYCNSFPQIKLKLAKDQSIENQREFKIITHGFYNLDPQIPINAPSCSGELWGSEEQLEINAFENILYDLSALLNDVHLKNIKFEVRYVDRDNSIDVSQKAYFIEDKKAAAKRYKFEALDLVGPEWNSAWRLSDEEEIIESIIGDLYKADLKTAYEDLRKNNPQASDEELSAAMASFKTISDQDLEKLKVKAIKMRDESLKKRKDAQLSLLKQISPASLAQTVLFSLMLSHNDWNILGISGHDDTFKNMELFRDSVGTYYIAPYDFDLSNMKSTTNDYKGQLAKFRSEMDLDFNGIVLPAIKKHGPDFIQRLENLPSVYPLDPGLKVVIEKYTAALKEFVASL